MKKVVFALIIAFGLIAVGSSSASLATHSNAGVQATTNSSTTPPDGFI